MPDILKHLGDNSTDDLDKQGRLAELPEWNNDIAADLARQENIKLNDAHMKVIQFLRNYHIEKGLPTQAHKVTEILDEAYADQGGSKYLHSLFPGGPVTQGCRLAGIPSPADSANTSFGSAQ